jgi:N6-adenosine-specific RNA methylase IME4
MRKYQVILADPAWKYRDDRKNDPGYAGITYDVMSTKDICALPVKEITDDNCMLFMWTTMPMLPDALEVMKAWGFKYKTCAFAWEKLNPRSLTPAYLMGQYTMGSMEICLLGTRGHPKRICKNVKQLVRAPRTGHSKKPEEVRQRIVELCGDVPRIELFARDCAPGWECLGNGIDGKDIREAIKEL